MFNKIIQILVLYPISILYLTVMFIRNRMFDNNFILKEKQFSIPIISVGNITVGGTGKTPHIEYLISILKDTFDLSTLSRGYKRKTKGYILANEKSTVYEIGDEPKQIKQKFPNIKVAVDEKRTRGIKQLEHDFPEKLDIILLDDAFQHRYIKPGLSILLIDYTQPMFNDHVLPYGRLRENRHEKRRANIIIITKTPKNIKPIEKRILIKNLKIFPFQNLYFTSLEHGSLTPLFNSDKYKDLQITKPEQNYSVLLVTGIANPLHLRKHVESFSQNVDLMQFPDHHNFKNPDILNIVQRFESIKTERKIIVTTEKDAMRILDIKSIEELRKLPVFFVPLTIRFLGKDKQEFDNQIINYVTKNKRNSNLHTK